MEGADHSPQENEAPARTFVAEMAEAEAESRPI